MKSRVDLTDFFFTHGALRGMSIAVEGTEVRNESHVDLPQHCDKYTLAKQRSLEPW